MEDIGFMTTTKIVCLVVCLKLALYNVYTVIKWFWYMIRGYIGQSQGPDQYEGILSERFVLRTYQLVLFFFDLFYIVLLR